jgi:hypothetical protein
LSAGALAALLAACAPARPAGAQLAPDSTLLPPAGYGTLRQDDVAVHLATPTVEIRLLPLDESIIRLLAPDSYQSLRALRQTRAPEIERVAGRLGIRRPGLFLVTFFGVEPQAAFTPDDLTVTSQNRFFRPAAILPVSPRWSELRLSQRETATALYLYEDGIVLDEPLVVSYGGVFSDRWGETVRRLERERSRVNARAASGAPR